MNVTTSNSFSTLCEEIHEASVLFIKYAAHGTKHIVVAEQESEWVGHQPFCLMSCNSKAIARGPGITQRRLHNMTPLQFC